MFIFCFVWFAARPLRNALSRKKKLIFLPLSFNVFFWTLSQVEQCAEYTTCDNGKPSPTEDQTLSEKKTEDDEDDDTVVEAPQKEDTCDMRQLKVNVKITFAKGNKGFAVKPTISNRIPEYHSEDAVLKGLRIPLQFEAAVIPPGSTEPVSVARTDFVGNCVLGKIIDNPNYNDTQVGDKFCCHFFFFSSQNCLWKKYQALIYALPYFRKEGDLGREKASKRTNKQKNRSVY